MLTLQLLGCAAGEEMRQVMQTATSLQQDHTQGRELTPMEIEARPRERQNWHQLAKKYRAVAARDHGTAME